MSRATARIGLALIAAAAIAGVSSSARAAACSGFLDVDDQSGFCPNVDWLKNRAITLGCTSINQYCPGNEVTRLQMAAFMNRLGVAMTPAVLYGEGTGGALDLDSPPQALCATNALAGASYPRSVQLGASLTAQAGASAAGVSLTLVQSTNGGTTWTALNALPATIAGASKRMNASVWKHVDLAVGTNYLFGLRVARTAGTGTTGGLTGWTCQVKGVAMSRQGSSAPF